MGNTSFVTIYNSFLDRITSDMYMEFTELDTTRQLQGLLLNAIPRFRFPRFDIYDYDEGSYDYMGTYNGVESDNKEVPVTGWVGGTFNCILSHEEIDILSLAMKIEWLGQQLTTTDLTRMRVTGSDFKMSSQANHMAKLNSLVTAAKADLRTAHDTYRRRKRVNGELRSTLGQIMEVPTYGYNIH